MAWAALVGCALLFASCQSSVSTGSLSDRDEAAEGSPVAVAVVEPKRETLSETLDLAAEFRPYQEIDLRARLAGEIEDIRVDVGDTVRQGQVIATLKVPESQSEVDQAAATARRSQQEVLRLRSEVERAESELQAARLVHSRLSGVYQSNSELIARQEIDTALARVQVAEAQLDAAKASLSAANQQAQAQAANEARARTMAEYAVITAPISGVVTRRYADKGSMIPGPGGSQSQAIVQVSEVDRLRLVLPVPESAVPHVSIGRPVQVMVPALQKTFEGRVARVSGHVDAATRTMSTEVDVSNPNGALKPGMIAFVELVIAHRDSALTLPVQAVVRAENGASVLLVNAENRIEPRPIVTGIETPTSVEVTSGLSDRDRVVVGRHSQFKPGQLVTPRQAQSAGTLEEN